MMFCSGGIVSAGVMARYDQHGSQPCLFALTNSVRAGPATAQLAAMLPKLFPLLHPILTRLTADALSALLGTGSANIGAKTRAALLGALLGSDAAWAAKDANAKLSLLSSVELGLCR